MNAVEITLHGILGDQMNKKIWKLKARSCAECIHAINILSKQNFYKRLLENDQKGIKYEVLINKNPCLFAEKPDINKLETLLNSEIAARYENLKTIDIVPVIEGADFTSADPLLALVVGPDIANIVTGVLLVAFGAFLAPVTGGLSLIMVFAGLGLIAAGVINLLTAAPKLEDFKGSPRRGSYMFDGPQNTVGEGGPVPLIYGQIIAGSQVIVQTYGISNENAGDLLTT